GCVNLREILGQVELIVARWGPHAGAQREPRVETVGPALLVTRAGPEVLDRLAALVREHRKVLELRHGVQALQPGVDGQRAETLAGQRELSERSERVRPVAGAGA